ncbi:hypothetical protein E2C01_054021 [Portunus trituberculatus]|uniref:Uncharacterized protein n=1 Tax=Portunus trituberculatus TaxID=210409 RepID=A0A5B7GS18_PORTR|nr:hypothetical protein [Portunus trituberculatus]
MNRRTEDTPQAAARLPTPKLESICQQMGFEGRGATHASCRCRVRPGHAGDTAEGRREDKAKLVEEEDDNDFRISMSEN